MRKLISSLSLVLLILASGNSLLAQATATGNIVGVVTDATGAALPAANVIATNQGTNAERTTTSNASGQYRFDLLPVGIYTVKVEVSGFSTAQAKDLQLLVGSTLTVNMPLKAGTISTSVEVTALNQLLDTEKTDSSSSVSPQQIT